MGKKGGMKRGGKKKPIKKIKTRKK